MLTRFEVTFLGIPVDSEHGDEEKQGAHMRMREAGACTRKQKERSLNARGCESDRARPTSYKPGELFHDPCRYQKRRISGRGSRTVRLGGW